MGLEFGKHGIEGIHKERDEQTEEDRIREDGEESDRIITAMNTDGLSDFEKKLMAETKNEYEILQDDISEEEQNKIVDENDKAIAESRESAKKVTNVIQDLFG